MGGCGLFLALQVHQILGHSWEDRLASGAKVTMAASCLSGARWLLECLYSTRLLKMKCESKIMQNTWERAVIERLRMGMPDGSPAALPGGSALGIWAFDLYCAELIRSRKDHAEMDDDEEEEQASKIFDHVLALIDPSAPCATSSDGADDTPIALDRLSSGTQARELPTTLRYDDLKRYLPEAEAEKAWAWLGDGDDDEIGTGAWYDCDSQQGMQLKKETFTRHVRQTWSDSRDLVSNIDEYNTIYTLFRSIVRCAFALTLVVIVLATFEPNALSSLWWTMSSVTVALSFVFGPLLREMFESLTLILVIRPFDVGDRVIILGKRMQVIELNFFTTNFLDGDTTRVEIKNSMIFSDKLGVCNLTRSGHTECGVELNILAEDSTTHNVEYLQECVRKECARLSETWVDGECGDATVNLGGDSGVLVGMSPEAPGVVRWRFRVIHKLNLQSPRGVRVDASKLLAFLVQECKDYGIRLQRPPYDTRFDVQPSDVVPIVVASTSEQSPP